MKILIVAHNLGMGGVERASSNLANALARRGHALTFLALVPKEKFFSLEREIRYVQPDGFNKRKFHLLNTARYVRREVSAFDPDLIICFTKFFFAVVNLSLLFTKYKIIVSERSSPFFQWPLQVEILSWISKTIRKPSAVFSQTSIAADHHRKYYRSSDTFVLPNIVNEMKLMPSVERQKVILCVGRFNDPCKGFDLMVQAFEQLKNKEWKLRFAGGDAQEGRSLLASVKDPLVLERIECIGRIRNMDEIFAGAGIFVMPSRSEGFPNALIEAMSAGLPCIAFDFVAGPRDIITEGEDGLIVPIANTQQLAQAIDRLIDDADLRSALSVAAINKAKRFVAHNIAKDAERILDNMLQKQRKVV